MLPYQCWLTYVPSSGSHFVICLAGCQAFVRLSSRHLLSRLSSLQSCRILYSFAPDPVPFAPPQAIRKSFLSLFTRKALNTYVQCQDGVIRDHVNAWLSQHSGTELDVKRIVRCAVALRASE